MIAPEVLEERSFYELLPVKAIGIDMEYQRRISPTKVRGIATRYDENSVGILIVSLREYGQYIVIDGQHRLAAMKRRGIEYAECKVHQGLTKEQEAAIYVNCNKNRKNPEALDLFRASLIAQDPIAIAINSVVEKSGLNIEFYPPGGSHVGGSKKRPPKSIWAVTALEEIYTRGKEELLEEVLKLAIDSWPDDGNALEGKILLGLTKFHLQYRGRYIREKFIARMNASDLTAIRRHARNRLEVDGGSMVTSIAKSLQEAYDKGRTSFRLESK